jgi:SOS-response transcriptional repressor LexA
MKTRQCVICPQTTTRARFRHPPDRTVCSQTCAMALARSERRHTPTPGRRARVLAYIIKYKAANDGLSPSYREISRVCAIPSTNTVLNDIIGLEKQNRITRHQRGIIVTGSRWAHPNPPQTPAPFTPTAPACPACPTRPTCTAPCTLITSHHQRATDRRDRIHAYLIKYKTANNGLSPSYREIARVCAIPSHSVVSHHLTALQTQGIITLHERGIIIAGGRWTNDNPTLETSPKILAPLRENLKGLPEATQ